MNRKSGYARHVPRVLAVCVVALVAFGLVYFIQGMLDKPANTKKMVQQITLIQPPPPPPPPPKLEEPPPPEVKEEIVKEEPTPEETPQESDEPPPGADLGLDAEGGAGGDAFGLLGKKGGRDLLLGGTGRFAWYSTIVKQSIDDLFAENAEVRKRRYSVQVRLWIKPDGQVDRAELAKSSGDAQTDQAYRTALAGLRKFSECPPDDMPQPILLRITSRS